MGNLFSWAQLFGEGKTVELVCPHEKRPMASVSGSTVVVLDGCLADCPLELPFELVAMRISKVIVRGDSCSSGRTPALLGKLQDLLTAFGDLGVEVVEFFPTELLDCDVYRQSQMPTATRRGLFGFASALPDDAPPLPNESLSSHRRLRTALRTLVSADSLAELPDSPGPGLILRASNCDVLGVCVNACPEGALALQSVDGHTRLLQDAGRCDGCRECLEACPIGALQVESQAGWHSLVSGDLVEVTTEKTAKCRKCGVMFPDGAGRGLCPTCSFRRENPFGSISPQEMIRRMQEQSGKQFN